MTSRRQCGKSTHDVFYRKTYAMHISMMRVLMSPFVRLLAATPEVAQPQYFLYLLAFLQLVGKEQTETHNSGSLHYPFSIKYLIAHSN